MVQAAALVVHFHWRRATAGSAFADTIAAAAGGAASAAAEKVPPLGAMLEVRTFR